VFVDAVPICLRADAPAARCPGGATDVNFARPDSSELQYSCSRRVQRSRRPCGRSDSEPAKRATAIILKRYAIRMRSPAASTAHAEIADPRGPRALPGRPCLALRTDLRSRVSRPRQSVLQSCCFPRPLFRIPVWFGSTSRGSPELYRWRTPAKEKERRILSSAHPTGYPRSARAACRRRSKDPTRHSRSEVDPVS